MNAVTKQFTPSNLPADNGPESYLAFSCHCQRRWHETFPTPIRAEQLGRRIGRVECPNCGEKANIHMILEEEPANQPAA